MSAFTTGCTLLRRCQISAAALAASKVASVTTLLFFFLFKPVAKQMIVFVWPHHPQHSISTIAHTAIIKSKVVEKGGSWKKIVLDN